MANILENDFSFSSKKDITKEINQARRKADEYFQTVNDAYRAIESLGKVLKRLGTNDNLKDKVAEILEQMTIFSKENIIYHNLNKLATFDINQMFEVNPVKILELVQTGYYQGFTEFGEGFLKGYGLSEIQFHLPPKSIMHIFAPNVIALPWLSLFFGPISYLFEQQLEELFENNLDRNALEKYHKRKGKGVIQIIKLSVRDPYSTSIFLKLLEEENKDFRDTIITSIIPSSNETMMPLYNESELVNVMGENRTITDVAEVITEQNKHLPSSKIPKRVFAHGNKESFGIIDTLDAAAAKLVAWGNSADDTYGCYSPTNYFISEKEKDKLPVFLREVASIYEMITEKIPKKKNVQAINSITAYRYRIEMQLAAGKKILLEKGNKGTNYTLVADFENNLYQKHCRGRTAIFKIIKLEDISDSISFLGDELQTVGLYINKPMTELLHYSEQLGRLGLSNVHFMGAEGQFKLFECHDNDFPIINLILSFNSSKTANKFKWLSVNFNDYKTEKECTLKYINGIL